MTKSGAERDLEMTVGRRGVGKEGDFSGGERRAEAEAESGGGSEAEREERRVGRLVEAMQTGRVGHGTLWRRGEVRWPGGGGGSGVGAGAGGCRRPCRGAEEGRAREKGGMDACMCVCVSQGGSVEKDRVGGNQSRSEKRRGELMNLGLRACGCGSVHAPTCDGNCTAEPGRHPVQYIRTHPQNASARRQQAPSCKHSRLQICAHVYLVYGLHRMSLQHMLAYTMFHGVRVATQAG